MAEAVVFPARRQSTERSVRSRGIQAMKLLYGDELMTIKAQSFSFQSSSIFRYSDTV